MSSPNPYVSDNVLDLPPQYLFYTALLYTIPHPSRSPTAPVKSLTTRLHLHDPLILQLRQLIYENLPDPVSPDIGAIFNDDDLSKAFPYASSR